MKKIAALLFLALCSSAVADGLIPPSIPPPFPVFAQTGGIYAFSSSNCRTKLERSNSGAAMNDTLPAASTLPLYCEIQVFNIDTTATETITPASGTIGTGSALALAPTAAVILTSDGSNWQVAVGSSTIPVAANVTTLTAAGAISTSTSITTPIANVIQFLENGAISAAFGMTGNGISVAGQTITDSTTATGTVTSVFAHNIASPTFATAANAITITNAYTLDIAGCPNAGAHITITTCGALRIGGGIAQFNGSILGGLGASFSGGMINLNVGSGTNSTNIGTGSTTGNVTIGGGGNLVSFGSHIAATGTAPVLTACGTSPTINGNDIKGVITEGSAATGCTATFATAFTSAPSCSVSSRAGAVFSYTVSASALTITNVGALSSTALDYHCTQ